MIIKKETKSKIIYTPSQIFAKIQNAFESQIGRVWVEGEITELSIPASGHVYFALKDKQSKIKAVMWQSRKIYASTPIANGLKVQASGNLSLYAPRGEFQLVAEYLRPAGEGELLNAFNRLKERLDKEGLFNSSRKRLIPFWPEKVALISSPDGAAVIDFLKTAKRLRPSAKISLYPTTTQGLDAASSMAQAIEDINIKGGFDLIAITRGGGSLGDLWAFNEEILVRAVASSRIPIIAAIGHATDETLVELTADQRAITPTAAAEMVYRDSSIIAYHIETQMALLESLLRNKIENHKIKLEKNNIKLKNLIASITNKHSLIKNINSDLVNRLKNLLKKKQIILDNLTLRLNYLSPTQQIAFKKNDFLKNYKKLNQNMQKIILNKRKDLAYLMNGLDLVSPLSVLNRGYSLTTKNGKIIYNKKNVNINDIIETRLAHGILICQVKEKND